MAKLLVYSVDDNSNLTLMGAMSFSGDDVTVDDPSLEELRASILRYSDRLGEDPLKISEWYLNQFSRLAWKKVD